MKNVFFNEDFAAVEKNIFTSLKIPSLTLMENAGKNSAEFIFKHFPELMKNEIIIITGKGNNGGDGFVIARWLGTNKIKVKVLMLYDKVDLKGDALTNFGLLEKSKFEDLKIVYCENEHSVKNEISSEHKLIIDSIFGIGFKGELSENFKKIFDFVNGLPDKTLIAVDIPSGMYSNHQKASCIKADLTLTMGAKKFETLFYEGREACGKIEIISIGINNEEFSKHNSKKIFETEDTDIKNILPIRKINSHKYTNGKVFILSGSRGLTGAAYLCSQAALRAGTGAVIVGIPESINDIMEIKLTEVMKLSLEETNEMTLSLRAYEKIIPKLNWSDCVLIGPGISKNKETLELVRKVVSENDVNYVIDADAISAFKNCLSLFRNKKIILTPHFGEFAFLLNIEAEELKNDFYNIAKKFTEEYDITLVLKNSPAIISNGNELYINSTGRENLATAGTGDVLSGIIAAVYSQLKDPLQSAIAGTYIHGNCGDNLYRKFGASSMIASDLINEIPNVKNNLLKIEN
ncbi:MAG: NAD(P)H-hydrate dehydratase [Ignavibacteria bacterium]